VGDENERLPRHSNGADGGRELNSISAVFYIREAAGSEPAAQFKAALKLPCRKG
jgi:hypothetical protein